VLQGFLCRQALLGVRLHALADQIKQVGVSIFPLLLENGDILFLTRQFEVLYVDGLVGDCHFVEENAVRPHVDCGTHPGPTLHLGRLVAVSSHSTFHERCSVATALVNEVAKAKVT